HHEKLCSDGIVAPHGFDPLISSDLGVVLVAVLCVFRRASLFRPVHPGLTRHEVRGFATTVPAKAFPPRKYVGAYSRYSTKAANSKLFCSVSCLPRHSHYIRVRLGGVTIWRIQCTTCKTVFTVLPHFVLRYRSMRPEVARDALLATHGGLSLE